MASATPSRHLPTQSRTRPNAPEHTPIEIPDLPPYETPEAPLNPDQQRALATLLSSRELKELKEHIRHATQELTDSAGQMGERLCSAQTRHETNKEKASQDRRAGTISEEKQADTAAGIAQEEQRLTEMEQQVETLRGTMEERMRKVIDAESRLQGLEQAIGELEKEEVQARTQTITRQTGRSMRRRPRAADEDGEEEEADEARETTPEREARELNAQYPPSRRLGDSLDQEAQKWDALSLTEKYAENNHYVGFYSVVHESRFPHEAAPPVPHSSTWFEGREDPNTLPGTSARGPRSARRNRNRNVSPAGSDDVAIQREKISLICPITLRLFQDPLTSTKCPHSFEREAIMSMISRSTTTAMPASGQGRRAKSIKCPECNAVFTAADLQRNAALVLKVQRAQKAQREAEEQMEDADASDDPNRVTLASDAVDEMDVDMDVDESDEPRVKPEPMTQDMSAQMARGGRASENEDEDDDNAEEEEEEEEEESVEEDENDNAEEDDDEELDMGLDVSGYGDEGEEEE